MNYNCLFQQYFESRHCELFLRSNPGKSYGLPHSIKSMGLAMTDILLGEGLL